MADHRNTLVTFISHTPAETESLGEQWGRDAQAGWVIGLTGDLGAGKTQLVKGLARGLGISSRVQSPSFALVNEYRGRRLPLFHIDLYRLDTREQIVGAGLEPYLFQTNGVTVVEWIERWLGEEESNIQHSTFNVQRSTKFRRVHIEAMSETERRITYEDFGR